MNSWIGWIAGMGGLVGLDGFFVEPNRLEVTRHEVPLVGLPESLEGYTIAHVTDTHLGPGRGAHRKTLASIEANDPDLVVCTGDLVESPGDLGSFRPFARRLVEISNDIVAVLGNWEHRHGRRAAGEIIDVYEEVGLSLLCNESFVLEDGVVIAGGDDPITGRFDADATFADLPEGPARIFAVHSPTPFDHVDEAPTFDLSLAGHTHGGQIRLGPFAPVTPRGSGRFSSGFYDTEGGRAYVSRGIGTTFVPARLMCLPELAYFELGRKE